MKEMKMHKSNYAKVFAGFVAAMGTISGVSSAQAEVLDLEDAVAAPKNPYVSASGEFSIQQFHFYPAFPVTDALTANVNKSLQFNGSTNYLTMNQGADGAAIIKSTTPGAVFDVFSIDLGSGARSEFVDVTVVALDADGFEI